MFLSAVEIVSAHGLAVETFVSDGGQLLVSSGGRAKASDMRGHSTEIVFSGGSAVGANLIESSTLDAKAGSTVSGDIVLSGGSVAIVSGAVAAGARIAISAGALELANVANFHGKIFGMANDTQRLDLLRFSAFTSGETVSWTQSGTSALTVHDGAKTATLILAGKYVSSDFHLAKDGQGGTLVTACCRRRRPFGSLKRRQVCRGRKASLPTRWCTAAAKPRRAGWRRPRWPPQAASAASRIACAVAA